MYVVYNLAHRDRDYRWVGDLTLPMRDAQGEKSTVGFIWDLADTSTE